MGLAFSRISFSNYIFICIPRILPSFAHLLSCICQVLCLVMGKEQWPVSLLLEVLPAPIKDLCFSLHAPSCLALLCMPSATLLACCTLLQLSPSEYTEAHPTLCAFVPLLKQAPPAFLPWTPTLYRDTLSHPHFMKNNMERQ